MWVGKQSKINAQENFNVIPSIALVFVTIIVIISSVR